MKPEQIDFIGFTDGFADHWTIVIDWGDSLGYESLFVSDNPSHPQGVFSSREGDYSVGGGCEKDWDDLPETLQKFIINYLQSE